MRNLAGSRYQDRRRDPRLRIEPAHLNQELLVEKLTAQAAARGITLPALLDRHERRTPSSVALLR